MEHAYGDAGDIPDLLKDLVDIEEDTRQAAQYGFFGKVWHQGTIYEATSYIVPYLVDIQESSQTPGRASVAGLLAAIANWSRYLEVHGQPDTRCYFFHTEGYRHMASQGIL